MEDLVLLDLLDLKETQDQPVHLVLLVKQAVQVLVEEQVLQVTQVLEVLLALLEDRVLLDQLVQQERQDQAVLPEQLVVLVPLVGQV